MNLAKKHSTYKVKRESSLRRPSSSKITDSRRLQTMADIAMNGMGWEGISYL